MSLGEAMARCETVIAAPAREAYVDELDPGAPVRLVDEDPAADSRIAARCVSCPSPSRAELSRQQRHAFLEARQDRALAETEAQVWQEALALLATAERSLAAGGAPAPVVEDEASVRSTLSSPAAHSSSVRLSRAPLLHLVGAR